MSGALPVKSLLEIKDVHLSRGDGSRYHLRIENFSIAPGEHVAITGPSGCGKSTTLDLAGMILEPDSAKEFIFNLPEGKVDVAALWKGNRLNDLTEIRRRNLGYVLQTGELFPFLRVRENIEITALAAGASTEAARKRAAELMERLEIDDLACEEPSHLSIGQRQRVAIARALSPMPKLLLADEPTAALDPGLGRKVMGLFMDTLRDYGASVLLVTHDLNLAREFDFRNAPISIPLGGDNITAVLSDGSSS